MDRSDVVLVDSTELESGGHLAVVSLNRPDELNPIDWVTVRRLGEVLDEVDRDPSARVIAITGRGRAFSAGGDMKKYATLQRDATDFPQFLSDIHAVFTGIGAMSKPVIALINGISVAGGTELLAACDFAIAGESARIGDAHLPFGQMGGGGALTFLPRLIGPARARELVMTGRTLDAREALAWGLVTAVVPDDQLVDAAVSRANEMARMSPLALREAKSVMNQGWSAGTGVEQSLRIEREATARYCLTSADAPEGLAAFAEKRRPNYVGR